MIDFKLGLVNWMNHKVLHKQMQASLPRKAIMIGIFLFFGYFSYITILGQWDNIVSVISPIF